MIHLSPAAALEVNRLKARQPDASIFFRLSVQPGGCSGFYYTLQFDQVIQPEDQISHCNDIQVVIDSQSLGYLDGLTLDYSEDLMGGGFRFHNPNATGHCSCGNSFIMD